MQMRDMSELVLLIAAGISSDNNQQSARLDLRKIAALWVLVCARVEDSSAAPLSVYNWSVGFVLE
jgi:hypothetical protein